MQFEKETNIGSRQLLHHEATASDKKNTKKKIVEPFSSAACSSSFGLFSSPLKLNTTQSNSSDAQYSEFIDLSYARTLWLPSKYSERISLSSDLSQIMSDCRKPYDQVAAVVFVVADLIL